MDIRCFVCRADHTAIAKNIRERRIFNFERAVKAENKTVSLRIHSAFIAKDLADDIWNGNDYLVHFDVNRTGSGEYTGCGHATDNYESLSTWEGFKQELDRMLKHYTPGYEIEEYGQICLF